MEIKIEKLVYGGDGLGRMPADDRGPGKTVFAPFVLEGETAEIQFSEQKKSFARGQVAKILQPSAYRVQPKCEYFQACGGCHYQHAGYEHQLEIKAAILKENLRRTAKLELECELETHASPPWNYRNRSRFKVRAAPAFALGYYKPGSHELLPVERCPVSSELINGGLAALWAAGREGLLAGVEEVEIFANAEDKELLLEIYVGPGVPRGAARQLAEATQALLPEITGVAVFRASPSGQAQPKHMLTHGAEALTYRTAHGEYRVSAGAFFQANRFMVDTLIGLVTGGDTGSLVLDLYAGAGLFSSILAKSFPQVVAVEPSQTSYSDLLYNSPANVKTVQTTTERYLTEQDGRLRPDLVVVDPPRGGLGERVVKALSVMGSPRLSYVSCDPATLARDLAGLTKAGYRIDQAHLVDMFPQTYHIESVFHLTRSRFS